MTDGEGHWAAIAELRNVTTAHERELGGLASKTADLADDVNALGADVRQTRHDTRNAITASEGRLTALIQEEARKIRTEQAAGRKERLTRVRFYVMVAAPLAGVLISFLLARSA